MLKLDLSKMNNREEIDAALGPAIGSGRVRGFLLKNVRRGQDGSFSWRINLQALAGNIDEIFEGMDRESIKARGGITGFPVLFISGENSDYIRAEDHQLLRDIFPTAEVVTIPGTGHWVHAEQPALLVKTIRYFLEV